MNYTNIDDLTNKVENEGMSEQGRLSASEFNRLIAAVKECQDSIAALDELGIRVVDGHISQEF